MARCAAAVRKAYGDLERVGKGAKNPFAGADVQVEAGEGKHSGHGSERRGFREVEEPMRRRGEQAWATRTCVYAHAYARTYLYKQVSAYICIQTSTYAHAYARTQMTYILVVYVYVIIVCIHMCMYVRSAQRSGERQRVYCMLYTYTIY